MPHEFDKNDQDRAAILYSRAIEEAIAFLQKGNVSGGCINKHTPTKCKMPNVVTKSMACQTNAVHDVEPSCRFAWACELDDDMGVVDNNPTPHSGDNKEAIVDDFAPMEITREDVEVVLVNLFLFLLCMTIFVFAFAYAFEWLDARHVI